MPQPIAKQQVAAQTQGQIYSQAGIGKQAVISYNMSSQSPSVHSSDMSLTDMIAQIKKEKNSPIQTEEKSVASVYNKNNETVVADAERIKELWIRFSRSIANTNTHLYSLMQKLPIIEGNKIYMTVSSELQAEKVHESTELIDFIRKQTGINSIEIITNIDESSNANTIENRIYTPKQKLDYLKEHNESIEYLIKSLSLDIT